MPDQVLLAWVTGEMPIPGERDTPFLRRLIAFNHATAAGQ